MIEELTAASTTLQSALERYLSACTAIQTGCAQGNWLQLNSAHRDLSDHVANEHVLVTTYETTLRTARTVISRARNYCTTITPINTLPDELLTRIFQLIVNSQRCTAVESGNKSDDVLFPKYPDLLSQVCSRWRHVSTNLCMLWSHIELAPGNRRLNQGLFNRAEMCSKRAGDFPLYIHVNSLQYQVKRTEAYQAFERFLESVSTQIKSLELLAGNTNDTDDTDDSRNDANILDGCLKSCKPGVLTELNITDRCAIPAFFWASDQDRHTFVGEDLESCSYEFLENLCHHVTVLRLRGLFPYWTSKAYHGLVELRLASSGNRDISIPESQLVAILSSSPQLHILHLDFDITDELPENALITPVHFDDLQVMSFIFKGSDQAGRLLRWLALGSLPLQLSVAVRSQSRQFLSNENVKGFFARSRITRLRLLGMHISYQKVAELLCQLPYLQVLALENSECQLDSIQADTPKSHPEEDNAPSVPTRLDHLYMLRCRSDIDSFGWLVEKRLTQMLTLWGCTIGQDTKTHVTPEMLNPFPVEFIAGSEPNPCNHWD